MSILANLAGEGLALGGVIDSIELDFLHGRTRNAIDCRMVIPAVADGSDEVFAVGAEPAGDAVLLFVIGIGRGFAAGPCLEWSVHVISTS